MLLVKALSMAAIGLLLAVAVGYGGGLFWFFDIFANFQIQYLMAGAAILVLALVLRQWRTASLAVGSFSNCDSSELLNVDFSAFQNLVLSKRKIFNESF